jgi:hypothetical protein
MTISFFRARYVIRLRRATSFASILGENGEVDAIEHHAREAEWTGHGQGRDAMRRRSLPVMGRRELLRWAGAASASTLVPVVACSGSAPATPGEAPTPASPAPPKPYFSSEDASILDALADAVLPPDDVPGGSALGVVNYISTLLTAFDSSPPMIYAGGPYSGREETPGADGGPSGSFPPDNFASFLPLDRIQTQAWKLRIYGSAGVAGGGPNDAITGPVIGLREGVATAIMLAKAAIPPGVAVDKLTQDEKVSMLTALDKVTQSTLIELVLEGCFTAPEYGGNTKQAGWKMMYFEGDSQPLGYSWYDTTKGAYTEDPEHPVSTLTPGADPMPMSAATEQLVGEVISILGGTVFP